MSYFQYTYEDLNDLDTAFADYINDPENTNPAYFFVGEGIKGYLFNWLNICLDNDISPNDAFVSVPEELHNYILGFIKRLTRDLKHRIRVNKDDPYWGEEYREWLECMEYVYKKLEDKKPYEE